MTRSPRPSRYTELVTPTQRADANQIAAAILQTPDYQLARRWLDRAGLRPRQCWKTCAVDDVLDAMFASSGQTVDVSTMLLALADAGFVAREIGGEPSTNVMVRTLRAVLSGGKRVSL